jgi:hypothetical protein
MGYFLGIFSVVLFGVLYLHSVRGISISRGVGGSLRN